MSSKHGSTSTPQEWGFRPPANTGFEVDNMAAPCAIVACMDEQADLFGDDKVRDGARALSRRGASRGGRARAESLSHETRTDIARRAALKRWGQKFLAASHVGRLVVGNQEISCAVLEDGTRVINQETYLTALGRARKAKGGTGGQSG